MKIEHISSQNILNPTGGFLGGGFTHTINLYRGCPLGNSLCGMYCYAQWNPYHTRGRAWGSFLDVKDGYLEAYRSQYDRLKQPARGEPKPIRIFMSSVTEPYPPQERTARRTRRLLEEMLHRPPDLLVIQSHTPHVVDDLDVLARLHPRCPVQINITVETDKSTLPGQFPRHAYTPTARIAALRRVRAAGLPAVCTVSPLLPLDAPRRFAEELAASCDRVILDHYLLGDGSPDGKRTKKTRLPELLETSGYATWTSLEVFHEVVRIFREVFRSADRVGVSQAGFNDLFSNGGEVRTPIVPDPSQGSA